jgi:hypothetical protein
LLSGFGDGAAASSGLRSGFGLGAGFGSADFGGGLTAAGACGSQGNSRCAGFDSVELPLPSPDCFARGCSGFGCCSTLGAGASVFAAAGFCEGFASTEGVVAGLASLVFFGGV